MHPLPPATFAGEVCRATTPDSIGNHAELAIHPGAVHAFTAFPYALAEEANDRIDAFLKAAYGENLRG